MKCRVSNPYNEASFPWRDRVGEQLSRRSIMAVQPFGDVFGGHDREKVKADAAAKVEDYKSQGYESGELVILEDRIALDFGAGEIAEFCLGELSEA